MAIIDQLASSLKRRDEVPNQELAQLIAGENDKKGLQEIVALLTHKSKDIQNDAIKVLYEIGERKPAMIAGYAKDIIALLDSKNNRMQWGAMTTLSAIAAEVPDVLYKALPKIVATSDVGTVITKDHCMKILVSLCSVKKYAGDAFALIIEQLMHAPSNQLPTYAEHSLPFVTADNKAVFVRTLTGRLDDVESETKLKRVEKAIAKAAAK